MSGKYFRVNMRIPLGVLCSVFILASCAQPPIAPDPDSVRLITMSEQARQIAQKQIPDAVLREVSTNGSDATFLFTDKEGTKEIDVFAPSPGAPPDQWTANVTSLSPLLGRLESDMNIKDLRAGPGRVAQALTAQWSGCRLRGLNLYRDESEKDLVWVGFCDAPQGTVSGELVNRTGVFRSLGGPPARVPVTATPAP